MGNSINTCNDHFNDYSLGCVGYPWWFFLMHFYDDNLKQNKGQALADPDAIGEQIWKMKLLIERKLFLLQKNVDAACL